MENEFSVPPAMEHEFDDLPVNNNNAFQVNEFAEEGQEILKEMSDPIQKRVSSKDWKIRLKTYEELQQIYSSTEEIAAIVNTASHHLQGITHEFVKISQESNPNVLHQAIQMMATFFGNIKQEDIKKDNVLQIAYGALTKSIIEKALSGKPALKKHASECLINMFDKIDSKVSVLENIQKLLQHKTVKIHQGALTALLELLENFGVEPFDKLKEFFPLVEKLSGSTNQNVKQDSLSFYKQAFLWMGEAVVTHHTKHLKKN